MQQGMAQEKSEDPRARMWPVRFQLSIKLTTAQELDIVVPPDILALAGNNYTGTRIEMNGTAWI